MKYFQKIRQIIFLPFWQNFFEFWRLLIGCSTELKSIRSLQNSKKFAKKVKIWFDEFFANTKKRTGHIFLTWVLCNRHPFSKNGIFPNFIEQKKQKRCVFGQKSRFEKKKFLAAMVQYFGTPKLAKSKNPPSLISSNYIQT